MSHKRSLQIVNPRTRMNSRLNSMRNSKNGNPVDNVGMGGNYSSVLPEIYAGHPQRIQRYGQYQQMDQDSDINGSLDTIADFSTQADEDNKTQFEFSFDGEPSDSEIKILKMCLKKWSKSNEFQNRLWRMVRSTLMYGDQFFLRDPETYKWMYIDPSMVESVFVNVNEGKKIIAYAIRDLVVNEDMLVASDQTQYGSNLIGLGTNTLQNNIDPSSIGGSGYMTHYNSGTENLTIVKAEYIVHLSLSEGLDAGWPFGTSFLESVYKVFKQKSLLEDAMLIYRIQRAPERRVFYIDTGDLPVHKANAYIERVKNETRQRRIPTRNGGGQSVTDAAYNPLSMIEDYFFAQSSTGRGSKVTTLEGGDALSSIDDMRYFSNVLKRGLRVPASYLPTGPEDNGVVFNDGRAGTAYIQEFRFAQFCRRIQKLLAPVFDREFKKFVENSGYMIDPDLYDINFVQPQHFSDFARIERDVAMINTYTPLADLPWMSKRFLLIKYLGWSEQDVAENEIKWVEENTEQAAAAGGASGLAGDAGSSGLPGLDSMGIRSDDQFDTDDDGNGGEEISPAETDEGGDNSNSGGLASDEGGVE